MLQRRVGSLCQPMSFYTSKSLESIFESLIKELFDAGEQHRDPTEQDLQLKNVRITY